MKIFHEMPNGEEMKTKARGMSFFFSQPLAAIARISRLNH
jgi:hypothetical protein